MGTLGATLLEKAFEGGQLVILWLALIVTALTLMQSRKKERKEVADTIFREWWDDIRPLRKYFFFVFLPQYRREALTQRKSLKELDEMLPEKDKGKPIKLCYFFDRLGWLAASGLVDVDYLLGPMQHTLRRVWIAMEPFIKQERARMWPGSLDPVYQFGFEWLFRRSSLARKHQARLVQKRFRKPSLRRREEIRALRLVIDEDEKFFRKSLTDDDRHGS